MSLAIDWRNLDHEIYILLPADWKLIDMGLLEI